MAIEITHSSTTGGHAAAETSITVGASPFSYQNTDQVEVDLIVTGGTVTEIAWSRNGSTFYAVGFVAGMLRLSPGDWARITYTIAPTIRKVPR